jgi:hypothetical protein
MLWQGLDYGAPHNLLQDIPEGARLDLEEHIPFKSSAKVTQYRHDGLKEGDTP